MHTFCEIQNLLRINILTCVARRKLLVWWYSEQLVPLLGCISLNHTECELKVHDFNEKVHYIVCVCQIYKVNYQSKR